MPGFSNKYGFGKRRGFYLLEMILALFLFATIAYPLLNVFLNYYRTSGKSRAALVGSHLAEQIMENQLSLGWQAVSNTPPPSVITYITDGEEIPVTYNSDVVVADLSDPDPTAVGMKHVVVTVTWTDTTGDRMIELESLLYWGG